MVCLSLNTIYVGRTARSTYLEKRGLGLGVVFDVDVLCGGEKTGASCRGSDAGTCGGWELGEHGAGTPKWGVSEPQRRTLGHPGVTPPVDARDEGVPRPLCRMQMPLCREKCIRNDAHQA